MNPRSDRTRSVAVVSLAFGSFVLGACSERQTPPAPVLRPAPEITTPTARPPASPASSTASEPVVPPQTATDVESKKGTETGMTGAASGTVGSAGKPGSSTGAVESSGETTEDKK